MKNKCSGLFPGEEEEKKVIENHYLEFSVCLYCLSVFTDPIWLLWFQSILFEKLLLLSNILVKYMTWHDILIYYKLRKQTWRNADIGTILADCVDCVYICVFRLKNSWVFLIFWYITFRFCLSWGQN